MRGFFCLLGLSWGSLTAFSQVNVLTANYDNGRSNSNLNETILTPSNVNAQQFGRVFTLPVDGQIYAQPLYAGQVAIPNAGTHNVLYVATQHNSVYAFDADAWTGVPLWHVNFGPTVSSDLYGFQDIEPEVGILGTPVIDTTTRTLYVVADNYQKGVYSYSLHALDMTTGAELQGGPTVISGAVPGDSLDSKNGTVTFDPSQHLQRPGLLLLNGVVYIGFGSHADIAPYHGWIMGYDAKNITSQLYLWCTSPNGDESAIWQSGRGLAADAAGNIYVSTGNGDFDGVSNFGESFLKFTPGANGLQLADWFAPDSWATWNTLDADLGSSGVAFVPNTSLIFGGGKYGAGFLVDTQNMGHTMMGNGQIVQSLSVSPYGVYSFAIWNGSLGPVLFAPDGPNPVAGFRFTGSAFETVPSLQSSVLSTNIFQGISVSSNSSIPGTGIVWDANWDQPTQKIILRAFNAEKPAVQLWDNTENPNDAAGPFAKFVSPMIANGKVYMPTFGNQVAVYGLTDPKSGVPQMILLTDAASYASGSVAPGEIITIFGLGMGPSTLTTFTLSADYMIPDNVGGTRVLFNGVPAPVLYSSAKQVSAIAPFGLIGTSVSVTVEYQGKQALSFTLPLAQVAPGLFALNGSGSGQGAFLNGDNSINGPTNPAARGDYLVLYASGLGALTATPADGSLVPVGTLIRAQDISVTIGGQPAPVLYAGSAPTEVAGLYQINVQVPANIAPGNAVPITVQLSGAQSQVGITAAIK